jgi:RNA polymerase primary sigma factor
MIVNSNIPLVFYVVKSYGYSNTLSDYAQQDLVQNGMFGLMRAVEEYNPDIGKFSTYAIPWIRRYVTEAFNDVSYSHLIKLTGSIRRDKFHIMMAKEKLLKQNGAEPTYAEIAAETGMSEQEILETMNLVPNIYSYNALTTDNDDDSKTIEMESRLQSDEDIAGDCEQREMIRLIMSELDSFSERQRDIIKLRYGIGYTKAYTLEEIGGRYNLTRERVRQIEKKAIEHLQKKFNP